MNNWRSDIGKAGYRAVVDLWNSNPSSFSSSEDRAKYVAENLKNFRFLYKFPEATVSTGPSVRDDPSNQSWQHRQGAFCSHLVSKVFALHIRKISTGRPEMHVPQVGRLALAAAAVRDTAQFQLHTVTFPPGGTRFELLQDRRGCPQVGTGP